MIIILGFFGFLGACLIYPSAMAGTSADLGWINIYGIKSNLSAFAFNTLMGMAGGIMAAWFVTRDAFWMMGGALCESSVSRPESICGTRELHSRSVRSTPSHALLS